VGFFFSYFGGLFAGVWFCRMGVIARGGSRPTTPPRPMVYPRHPRYRRSTFLSFDGASAVSRGKRPERKTRGPLE
jgi:hypothetical protein